MTRLTNDMRGEIVNAVMFHKYNEPAVAMVARVAELAQMIYDDVLTMRERRMIEGMPKGWLPTDDDLLIAIENLATYKIPFAGRTQYNCKLSPFITETFEKILKNIPQKLKGVVWKVYYPEHSLARLIVETFDDKETLIKEIDANRKRLTATINKFTTVEKLIDAWPEVEKFVPEQKKPIKLPALPVEELNRQFNLP